ncbi:hypothetical protein BS78_04G255200 [Paspalum vaginatum]|nr:hypothetical protein BS78_04G255200 [Paspalum vaginatum]
MMMAQELRCTILCKTVNPNYIPENHLARTATDSGKMLVFKDSFVSCGKIHDIHLANIGSFQGYCHPLVVEHAILRSYQVHDQILKGFLLELEFSRGCPNWIWFAESGLHKLSFCKYP